MASPHSRQLLQLEATHRDTPRHRHVQNDKFDSLGGISWDAAVVSQRATTPSEPACDGKPNCACAPACGPVAPAQPTQSPSCSKGKSEAGACTTGQGDVCTDEYTACACVMHACTAGQHCKQRQPRDPHRAWPSHLRVKAVRHMSSPCRAVLSGSHELLGRRRHTEKPEAVPIASGCSMSRINLQHG